MPTKIETFLAKKKKLEAELEALLEEGGQKTLSDSFKAAFDQVPELESLIWTQYTPHFNDGDPCRFGVHEFNATFNVPVKDLVYVYDRKTGARSESIEELPAGEEFEEVAYGGYGNREEDPILVKTRAAVKPLDSIKSSCKEVFESAFGDGVKVTASREGFSVDDYDHD